VQSESESDLLAKKSDYVDSLCRAGAPSHFQPRASAFRNEIFILFSFVKNWRAVRFYLRAES